VNRLMLTAVLIATVSWGLGAVFDKTSLNSMPDLPIVSAVVVRQAIALAALCILGAFNGSLREVRKVPTSAWVLLCISGAFGVGIAGVAYYYAVQHGEISRISVFCSGYPIITLLLAVPILREALTVPKVVGTVLVVSGLVVLSGGG